MESKTSNAVRKSTEVGANNVEFDIPEGYSKPARQGTNCTVSTHRTIDSVAAERDVNQNLSDPLTAAFPTIEAAADAAELLASELKQEDVRGLLPDEDELVRTFRKGAVLAKSRKDAPTDPADIGLPLTDVEAAWIRREETHRWTQPWPLILLAITCSLSAGVQGMDETVINGAQIFYKDVLSLKGTDSKTQWILGLVNSAPYLCCALIGCWLTKPFNRWFGRKGTIFLTCLISSASCLWQGFVWSWWHLFLARFVLGVGIGAKSSTVPIYAAECAPTPIRGAFVMMWQLWTAFGIFLGFVCDVAFYDISSPKVKGLNWRLMLSSPMVLPLLVCCTIWFSPESPRLLIKKERYLEAYKALRKLRNSEVQASRDFFAMKVSIDAEKNVPKRRKSCASLLTRRRNRTALLASQIVMFMQQFCGINVIAYYSSEIFLKGGFTERNALLASMGFGLLNFLGAFPAVITIDKFGRRPLLLCTFPVMALCLFATGGFFHLPDGKVKLGLLGAAIYIFAAAYSPGAGPVPFTYSAEAYPLQIREIGMSLATATTWMFNFILAITWPAMQQTLTPTGAFAFYGAWNVIGWFATLFFVPETKGRSLEELDEVFNKGS